MVTRIPYSHYYWGGGKVPLRNRRQKAGTTSWQKVKDLETRDDDKGCMKAARKMHSCVPVAKCLSFTCQERSGAPKRLQLISKRPPQPLITQTR